MGNRAAAAVLPPNGKVREAVVDDAQIRRGDRLPEPLEPRALRGDAVRNRLRILDAAAAVFRDRGLGATTRAVARYAGVSEATVHRRFPDRAALLGEIAERTAARLGERFHGLAAGVPADLALERALRLVAAETVATRACTPDYRARFPDEARRHEEGIDRGLHRLLSSARESGRISPAVTAEDLRLLTASVDAVAARTPDPGRSGPAAQRVVTHFLRSFRSTG